MSDECADDPAASPLDVPVREEYSPDARIELTLATITMVRQRLDGDRQKALAYTHELVAKYGPTILEMLWLGWATYVDRLRIPAPAPPSGMLARAYAVNFVRLANDQVWWANEASRRLCEQIMQTWAMTDAVTLALLDFFPDAPEERVREVLASSEAVVLDKAAEWRREFDA